MPLSMKAADSHTPFLVNSEMSLCVADFSRTASICKVSLPETFFFFAQHLKNTETGTGRVANPVLLGK